MRWSPALMPLQCVLWGNAEYKAMSQRIMEWTLKNSAATHSMKAGGGWAGAGRLRAGPWALWLLPCLHG